MLRLELSKTFRLTQCSIKRGHFCEAKAMEDVHWEQRFENYDKVLRRLEEALAAVEKEPGITSKTEHLILLRKLCFSENKLSTFIFR